MTPAHERVAVVIVNWNGAAVLRACLRSVAAQTVSPARVLVVDNGSSDGSCEGLSQEFPAVEVVRLGRNVGFAAANNRAAERVADCRWIAALNPDAFPDRRWLESLLLAAASHPQHVSFGSRMLQAASPDKLDGVGDVYHVTGLVWREGRGRGAAGHYIEEQEIFSPCAAAALYRRDVFLALGGFDEDYFCYLEDVDLGFRLRLAGHRCLYVPTAVVLHQGSAVTGVRSDFALYHGHRNLAWTFVKNVPGVWFWLLLPLHLAASLTSVVVLACLGRGAVAWRARADACRGLAAAWRKRAAIQSRRTARAVDVIRMMRLSIRRSDLF